LDRTNLRTLKKVKYLILGAGVSGVSAAVFLSKNTDYIILEKTDSVGGYCKTIKKDGFTWDYSGHFFHFRNKEIRDLILSNIKNEELLTIKKRTAVLYKDQTINFPFQRHIAELDKSEFLECLYDFYFRESKTSYDNFLEWITGTLGAAIVNKFVKPYNEKLYATELTNLDVHAMGRFFPQITLDEIVSSFKENIGENSYNSEFLYPKNGAITYIQSLMNYVDQEKIKLNSEAFAINTFDKIVKANDVDYQYEYLITTIPLNSLLAISHSSFDPEIYTGNKVLVLNLGFDQPSESNHHWLYVPSPEISFYRVGFYDKILNENRASLYVEIGMKSNQDIDKELILKRVLSELKLLKLISNHKLIAYEFVEMNPAYIHLTQKSIEDSKKQRSNLENLQIFSIGRYGEWTYCAIEDNIISARACIDRIKND
jgi:protoporphyrinogen oxidase